VAYDALTKEETRGGGIQPDVDMRGRKKGGGRRGGGSGGSVAARLHQKWATIEEGTHWGGARNGVLHVGRAWHPAAGPSWAGPEEQ
jgi:hypothetical protein